ncbi:MAG: periplasmic heavy metal sensor [Sulfuricella sp.]|nr:periplasmic heavy metal sensor [Sulfuricella sp.]
MKAFKISVLAAALLIGAGVAVADAGKYGPEGGPMMAGMEKVHTQLKLNPEQEAAWKAAQEKSRAVMQQSRESHRKMHEAMKQELAKSEPDFAAVARISDETQEGNLKARHEARDQWLKLYATFTPEQKLVARDFMRERMARMDKMGDKMQERFQRGAHRQAD